MFRWQETRKWGRGLLQHLKKGLKFPPSVRGKLSVNW